MDNENEYPQDDVVVGEEQASQEEEIDETSDEEETITIPKSKFNSIRRKAQAYEANKDKPQKTINSNSDAKWRERLELKVEGYDDQAIDFIQKNGGKKSLENPYIVKAIEAIKEQRLAEKATVEDGSKSVTEKRFSPNEFSKLSAAEQEKVLSDLR